jgi:hypothetical protein
MSTRDTLSDRPVTGRSDGAAAMGGGLTRSTEHRRTTETKAAFKTTEFMAYLAFLVALFIAGAVLDQSDAGGLGGKQVWLYGTILTGAYMISRGLAKSGSRDPYTESDDEGRGNRR